MPPIIRTTEKIIIFTCANKWNKYGTTSLYPLIRNKVMNVIMVNLHAAYVNVNSFMDPDVFRLMQLLVSFCPSNVENSHIVFVIQFIT